MRNPLPWTPAQRCPIRQATPASDDHRCGAVADLLKAHLDGIEHLDFLFGEPLHYLDNIT